MALLSLELRDFVIVRALNLDFAHGFTVLTGETGAGKSILIDALQLALGARADSGVVREGAARTEISARFSAQPIHHDWLSEHGFDTQDEVLLRRAIDSQGKSRAWINGSAATATQLRELGDLLVDIHGQHAWQSLTRGASVRTLLDAFGRIDLQAVGHAWHAWHAARSALNQASAQQATLAQERERLVWQINEMARVNPQLGEWEQLNAQHTKLSHAQTLIETAESVCAQLDSDERGGAIASVSRAVDALAAQTHVEPEFQALADLLGASQAQLEEALHGLRAYLRHADHDDATLQQLDERMSAWLGLAKRFRVPPETLAEVAQDWQTQLQALEAQSDLNALQQVEQATRARFEQQAHTVSAQRQAAAQNLSREVSDTMQTLGMGGGRLQVDVRPQGPSATGADEVEFLVAGHAGVTPRPIGKVASGGELSRIALAIAVKTSALGQAQTLIFDEVDSGVGGAVADAVGQLMHRLGVDRQVLAVTHLPQVAAAADHHVRVSKQADGGQTVSSLQQLAADERVQEIARMLGGSHITQATLNHASELLGPRDAAPASAAPEAASASATSSAPARRKQKV